MPDVGGEGLQACGLEVGLVLGRIYSVELAVIVAGSLDIGITHLGEGLECFLVVRGIQG